MFSYLVWCGGWFREDMTSNRPGSWTWGIGGSLPIPPFLSPRPHSFLECVFSLPFRLPGATPRTQPKVLLTLSGC